MKLTKTEVVRFLKAGLEQQFAEQKLPQQIKELSLEDFEFDEDGNLETLEIEVTYRTNNPWVEGAREMVAIEQAQKTGNPNR